MDRETKSLQKTVKQFNKLARKIPSGTPAPSTGTRLKRTATAIGAAAVLLMILVPPFVVPVDGSITSGFFLRRRPESVFALNIETHKGIDLAAPQGTRVVAAAPGIVTATGTSESYGNFVEVSHLLGFQTYYAHLSEITVRKGRILVLRGLRPIGRVGSTGRSTGPHLHFETRLFGRALPPRFLLVFHGIRRAILRF